jgi:hypothetical protein
LETNAKNKIAKKSNSSIGIVDIEEKERIPIYNKEPKPQSSYDIQRTTPKRD